MQYYNTIDASVGIDVNKTGASKECIICHYQYFLDNGFTFQPTVCNGCHEKLTISVDINSIIILIIHGVDIVSLAKLKL